MIFIKNRFIYIWWYQILFVHLSYKLKTTSMKAFIIILGLFILFTSLYLFVDHILNRIKRKREMMTRKVVRTMNTNKK